MVNSNEQRAELTTRSRRAERQPCALFCTVLHGMVRYCDGCVPVLCCVCRLYSRAQMYVSRYVSCEHTCTTVQPRVHMPGPRIVPICPPAQPHACLHAHACTRALESMCMYLCRPCSACGDSDEGSDHRLPRSRADLAEPEELTRTNEKKQAPKIFKRSREPQSAQNMGSIKKNWMRARISHSPPTRAGPYMETHQSGNARALCS